MSILAGSTGATAPFRVLPTFALIATLLASTVLVGCRSGSVGPGGRVTGSGNLVEQPFAIEDFDSIEASGAFQVEVSRGDGYEVVVTTNDNVVDFLDVRKEGNTLVLGLRDASYTNATFRARVSLPDLRGLRLSGASNATINGFDSDNDLALDLSGASRATGEIRAGGADFALSGASSVELRGGAETLDLNGSGASESNLADFPVSAANVELNGGSRATVNVAGRLDGNLSGGATLTYTGNPEIGNFATSGGASLRRR